MIVVTTPTGKIGHYLVRDLIERGERLRVIVRDAANLPAEIRDQVEVVQGSHGDAQTIEHALDGADALFWVVPPAPAGTMDETYSAFTRPAVEAISKHGVGHVVVVTALGRSTRWQHSAGLVSASLRMVDRLNGSGAAVRGLAMPGFMENLLRQVGAIRQGQFFDVIDPDRRMPHTATRDMAAVAARLLAHRAWAGQEDVAVLGPEDLSFDEIAAILSDVLGRTITYVQVPMESFKAQLLERKMPEDFAQGFMDMMRAKNEGMDNEASHTAARLGPTSFRQWAEAVLKPALAR